MTRAKCALLPAICAVAFAVATPALALNPQPLPPGAHRGASKLSPSAFTIKQGFGRFGTAYARQSGRTPSVMIHPIRG